MNNKIYNILLEEYKRIRLFNERLGNKYCVEVLSIKNKKDYNSKRLIKIIIDCISIQSSRSEEIVKLWNYVEFINNKYYNAFNSEQGKIINLSDFDRFIYRKDSVERLLEIYKNKKERE